MRTLNSQQEFDTKQANLYNSSPLLLSDLPELVEPIARFVYEYRPLAAVANDRGARLAGLALYKTFTSMYRQPFPTTSRCLEFVNIRKSQIDFNPAVNRMASIHKRSKKSSVNVDLDLLFLDDWVDTGETVSNLLNIAEQIEIDPDRIAIATLCGRKLPNITHIVSSTMTTLNSEWNSYEEMTGLVYSTNSPNEVKLQSNPESMRARQKLDNIIYERYNV